MIANNNYLLEKYGLKNFYNFYPSLPINNNLARIIFVAKNSYKAITNAGTVVCFIKGSKIYYDFTSDTSLPKVGDFVILQNTSNLINVNNHYFIKEILPRKNTLKRKIAGESNKEQIIVANVDYAFITISLDEQFNLSKAKRILISVLDSNIKPVFVLTKIDLVENITNKINEIKDAFKDIVLNLQIIATTIVNPSSIEQIKDILYNKKDNIVNTGVFIGSSGSGKSSMINILLGKNVQKTATVSALEHKGRHTTTSREMFLLEPKEGEEYAGIIIDTPGMREFGLFLDDEDTITQAFVEIKKFAKLCKFNNCKHINEPNCAVLNAVDNGLIKQEQLNEYLKLKDQTKVLQEHLIVNKAKDKKYKHKKNQETKNFKKHIIE